MSLQSESTRILLFLTSVFMLIIGYLLSRAIILSKLGQVVTAIRDGETKARFMGYRAEKFKVFIFVVSAIMAAVAGALYVPQVGIINPSVFSPLFSIELVIWVAVGGRNSLYGAIIGAFIVNYTKTYFTAAWPDAWLYALGALFILVTLFLPKGVVGLSEQIKQNQWVKSRFTQATGVTK